MVNPTVNYPEYHQECMINLPELEVIVGLPLYQQLCNSAQSSHTCLCLNLSRTGRRPLWHLNQLCNCIHEPWLVQHQDFNHCGASAYYVISILKVAGFRVFHSSMEYLTA